MGEILFDTNWLIELYKLNKENIEGYTTIFNLIEYPKAIEFFNNIQIIYPTAWDYETAIVLSIALYKIGKPIPTMDILIAAICYNLKLSLISRDTHFNAVCEVWNNFKLFQDYKSIK